MAIKNIIYYYCSSEAPSAPPRVSGVKPREFAARCFITSPVPQRSSRPSFWWLERHLRKNDRTHASAGHRRMHANATSQSSHELSFPLHMPVLLFSHPGHSRSTLLSFLAINWSNNLAFEQVQERNAITAKY